VESFFGIGGPELVLILVLATIILGPLNMIKMARQFGILMRDLRNYYQSLTANLSQELGDLAQLQETWRGEISAAIPKPEELQMAVPDLMAEAQKALDPSVPSQPETSPSQAVSSSPAETKAAQVVASTGGAGSQPEEPEQARTAQAPADGSEAKS
jgi:Sec-independent protein translocase protein TatA